MRKVAQPLDFIVFSAGYEGRWRNTSRDKSRQKFKARLAKMGLELAFIQYIVYDFELGDDYPTSTTEDWEVLEVVAKGEHQLHGLLFGDETLRAWSRSVVAAIRRAASSSADADSFDTFACFRPVVGQTADAEVIDNLYGEVESLDYCAAYRYSTKWFDLDDGRRFIYVAVDAESG